MKTEQVDLWRWTHWPVIRLFRLPVIGTLLHVVFVAIIMGTCFGIAAAYGKLAILKKAASNDTNWVYLTMFGVSVWIGTYVCSIAFGLPRLRQRMYEDKPRAMVIWHLCDMAYHLVRWSLFFGLISANNVVAASVACAIELLMAGAALAVTILVGLGYCCYLTERAIYEERKQDIRSILPK